MDQNTAPFKVFDFELRGEEVLAGTVAIKKVISVLRPDWPIREIKFKHFSGGIVNTLVCFYRTGDIKMKEGIVIRVFGPIAKRLEGKTHFRRDIEFLSMQLASHAGVATPILASFRNGWVYRLAPGRTLHGSDLHRPSTIRAIARAMAQLHSVDVDSPLWNRQGRQTVYPRDHNFFDYFISVYRTAPDHLVNPDDDDRYRRECRPFSYWLSVYEDLRHLVTELHLPQGLAHIDLHDNNIIYDDAAGEAHFVDYEMTCIGYQAFDFRGCFLDIDIRRCIPHFRDPSEPDFSEEEIRLWLTEYLKRRNELQGLDGDHVTEYDVTKLRLECQLIQVLNYVHWILVLYVIMTFTGTLDWPMVDVIKLCEKRYEELKPLLPHLASNYRNHLDLRQTDTAPSGGCTRG